MGKKTYYSTSGVVFFIVTIAHLLRIILKLDLTLGGSPIPMWISWAAVILAGILSYHGLKFNHKTK